MMVSNNVSENFHAMDGFVSQKITMDQYPPGLKVKIL